MSDRLPRQSDVEAVAQLLARRFRLDARGRVEAVVGEAVDPPRFCLARTAEGALWRFRSDLPEAMVRPLARYAAKEGPLPESGRLPERQESFLRILWPEGPRPDQAVRRYWIVADGGTLEVEPPAPFLADVFDYA